MTLNLPSQKLPARQVALAVDLIESWSEKRFNFHQYEDRYRNRVAELIEKKISGKDTVDAEDEEEEMPVINLMEALRKSLKAKSTHQTKERSSNRK